MSKSFEWAINRAKNSVESVFHDRNWDEAEEVDSKNVFETYFSDTFGLIDGLKNHYRLDHGNHPYFIELSFDAESDYSYFSSTSSFNDSTLFFQVEAMKKLAHKVLTLGTADKVIIEKGIDWFHNIKWTIGNFIVLNEYLPDLAPKDMAWLQTRLTVLLPLRMEVS